MSGIHTGGTKLADLAALAASGVPVNADRSSRYATLNVKRPRRYTDPHRTETGAWLVRVKRVCNGCGLTLGDATDAELAAAEFGELPDVRGECPRCSGEHP